MTTITGQDHQFLVQWNPFCVISLDSEENRNLVYKFTIDGVFSGIEYIEGSFVSVEYEIIANIGISNNANDPFNVPIENDEHLFPKCTFYPAFFESQALDNDGMVDISKKQNDHGFNWHGCLYYSRFLKVTMNFNEIPNEAIISITRTEKPFNLLFDKHSRTCVKIGSICTTFKEIYDKEIYDKAVLMNKKKELEEKMKNLQKEMETIDNDLSSGNSNLQIKDSDLDVFEKYLD